MTLQELQASFDWEEVFKYAANPGNPLTREVLPASYKPENVVRIIASDDGESDGTAWVDLFQMSDRRFLLVEAGCDYTGWGCQEGGSSEWTSTEAEAIAYLTPEVRGRLFPLVA